MGRVSSVPAHARFLFFCLLKKKKSSARVNQLHENVLSDHEADSSFSLSKAGVMASPGYHLATAFV